MAVARVDWIYWIALPEIQVWQAVALTLNIDPNGMHHSPHGWMAGPGSGPMFEERSFLNRRVKEEFGKRLALLSASITDRTQFTAGKIAECNAAFNGVQLSQVVTWLQSLDRKIRPSLPKQLLAVVARSDKTDVVAIPRSIEKYPWVSKAKELGEKIRAANRKLSQESIATQVATELTAAGITKRGGKPVSAGSIRRHALKGI